MLGFLLRLRWRRLTRVWHTQTPGQRITAAAFGVVFLCLAVGFGALLSAGLQAVQENEFLRTALPFFLYELFLLVIIGLVFVSATISALFTLFRGRGNWWMIASPRHFVLLFDTVVTVALISLWPLLVIAVPMLWAMHVVYGLGWVGVILGAGAVVGLGVGAVLAAVATVLLVGYGYVAVTTWCNITPRLQWYALVVAGVMVLGGTAAWYALADVDLTTLFAVQDYTITEAPVALIAAEFQYFPSHVGAEALFAIQTGDSVRATYATAVLLGAAFLLAALVASLRHGLLPLWQRLQETGFAARQRPGRARSAPAAMGVPATPVRALFWKEWTLFVRSPRDVLWLGFLLALWLVVTGFDVLLRENLSGEALTTLTAPQFIQALQLLVMVYFSAAIVLRFAFPAFSVERDTAWILLHAPLSRGRWFLVKIGFFAGVLAVLSLVVALVHVALLPSSGSSTALFLLYVVVSGVMVAVLGVALGARYPNFSTSDPQQLSTTLPGLSFIVLAITYGVASAASLYATFATGSVLSVAAFLGGSVGLGWYLTRSARQRLPYLTFSERLES